MLIICSCNSDRTHGTETVSDPDDETYSSYANKICMCVNESSKALPSDLKQLILDSEGDAEVLESLLEEYAAQQGVMRSMGDIFSVLLLENNLEICFKGIQTGMDESDFTTAMSNEERLEKIMEKMNQNSDCAFSYCFLNIILSLNKIP